MQTLVFGFYVGSTIGSNGSDNFFYRLLHDIFYIAPEIITRLITEFATRVAQRVSLVEGTAYLSEAPAWGYIPILF